MKQFFKLFTLCLLTGCSQHKDYRESFNQWNFDSNVIKNFSKYDSLRGILLPAIDSFHLSEEKYSFTYIYNFDTLDHQISGYSNNDLPKHISQKAIKIIRELGKNNIFGFSISKDSSIDIFIRNTHLLKYYLDVRERLEWKPYRKKHEKLEFPFKDTSLTDQWRYWVWFDKRAEF